MQKGVAGAAPAIGSTYFLWREREWIGAYVHQYGCPADAGPIYEIGWINT